MAEVIKVCVRIPSNRKNDLMEYAKKLRKDDSQFIQRAPGWDAKVIHKIAKEKYGDLLGLFENHGWSERGKYMMPVVQTRVKQTYGSVEEFSNKHKD